MKTNELIESLAQRLGVTADYLYDILMQQALVSATITLIFVVAVIVFGVVLAIFHRKYTREDRSGMSRYDSSNMLSYTMFALFAIWLVGFAFSMVLIPCIIHGYFYPEIFALKQIMGGYLR